MSKTIKEKTEQQTTVTINDEKYIFENMNEEQQAMVNHIADLDRKINTSRFNLDQLLFGKDAFMGALNTSLKAEKEAEAEAEA